MNDTANKVGSAGRPSAAAWGATALLWPAVAGSLWGPQRPRSVARARKVDLPVAASGLPYVAWVASFATALTFALWRQNR